MAGGAALVTQPAPGPTAEGRAAARRAAQPTAAASTGLHQVTGRASADWPAGCGPPQRLWRKLLPPTHHPTQGPRPGLPPRGGYNTGTLVLLVLLLDTR